jgi:two-component system phosphate regulon response regulator OmpR
MSARVLILAADGLQRDLMVMSLKRHQLEPLACATPAEAQHLLTAERPGLLVIDLLLRGQNGLDFIREMTSLGLLDDVKILMLSPLGLTDLVLKAVRAGAGAFLIKPVDPDQLAEKAKSLLETRKDR